MYLNGIFEQGEGLSQKNLAALKAMAEGNEVIIKNLGIAFESDNYSGFYGGENHRISVFFAGQLYNAKELSDKLSLNSAEPCFVVAKGFEKFGKDIIKMCDGEFLIFIYDAQKNSLTVARDRIGTAPVYYFKNDRSFIFSTSLKNLLGSGVIPKEIDETALSQYFQLTYIPAPKSIIKGVSKILPATIFEVDSKGEVITSCYWDVDLKITSNDYKEAKSELHRRLSDSVRKRLDVKGKSGAFLSGGFDSTIIVGLMAENSAEPVNTFTIGFDNKTIADESPLAQLVADKNKTNHTRILLDWNSADAAIERILTGIEEPFADSSLISTYMVCKKTSEFTDYALTGDAGDELFAGYNKYLVGYYNQRFQKIPRFIRNGVIKPLTKLLPQTTYFANKVKKFLAVCDLDVYEQRKQLMSLGFKTHEMEKLMTKCTVDPMDFLREIYTRFPHAEEQTRAQYLDLKVVLDGCMLPKVKIGADLAGFRTIAPILDTKVVEHAFSMPASFKIKKKQRKIILKDTFSYLIPEKLFSARKHGFGVPIDDWLRTTLKDKLYEAADKNYLEKQGIFNHGFISEIIENHMSGKENRGSELWTFLVFQSWYKNYIEA